MDASEDRVEVRKETGRVAIFERGRPDDRELSCHGRTKPGLAEPAVVASQHLPSMRFLMVDSAPAQSKGCGQLVSC